MLQENIVCFTKSLKLGCGFFVPRVLIRMRSKGKLGDFGICVKYETRLYVPHLFVSAFDDVE